MGWFGWFRVSKDSGCVWTQRRNLTLHKSRWCDTKLRTEFAIRLGIYAYGWGCGDRLQFEELGKGMFLYDPISYKVTCENDCVVSYNKEGKLTSRIIEIWEFEVHAEASTVRVIMEATIIGLKTKKESKREEKA